MTSIYRAFLTLTFVLLSITTQAQQPKVEATLSQHRAEVGEALQLTMKFDGSGEMGNWKLDLPKELKPKVRVGDFKQVESRVYTADLRPMSSGDLLLTGLTATETTTDGEVIYLLNDMTAEVLEVTGDPTEQIAEYTGLRAIPHNYLLRNVIYTFAGVVSVALIALLIFWILKRNKKRMETTRFVPPTPPIVVALQRLRDLESLTVFNDRGAEAHYTELSALFRQFLEDHTGVPAREMTEDELIQSLSTTFAEIPEASKLAPVLQRTSMAKFAQMVLDGDLALKDCKEVEAVLVSEEQRILENRQADAALRKERASAA